MTSLIRANRMEVSDRFPVLGLTIHTDPARPWFEVTLATDPALFRADQKSRRTHNNFYSTRAIGALPTERNEMVYLVPTEILARFIGGQQLYYALATFPDAGRSKLTIDVLPTANSPWIGLQTFTGRSLRRVSGLPNPRGGLAGGNTGYGANGATLDWAGDTPRPGVESISTPAPAATSPAAPAKPATGVVALVATQSGIYQPFDYDDGFDPNLWSQPQGLSLAQSSGIESEYTTEETSDIPVAQALRYSPEDEDGDYVSEPQSYTDKDYYSEPQGYADAFDAEEEAEQRYYADTLAMMDEGVEEAIEPTLGYGQGYGEEDEDRANYTQAPDVAVEMTIADHDYPTSQEHTNGYAAPAVVVQAAPITLPSPVAGATLTRVQDKRGAVSWELDQLQGFKHLDSQSSQASSDALQSASMAVAGPSVNIGPGDQVAADFEVRWRYNGRSLGDIEIVQTRATGVGANLHVMATIVNDTNIYTTTPPSDARFAGLHVRFHYRFSRPGVAPLEADTDVTLYGNGTASKIYRWSQA